MWQGNVDNIWTILRRTYVPAVIASLNGGAKDVARDIQLDSGAAGAEQFHRLVQLPTGAEDTVLLEISSQARISSPPVRRAGTARVWAARVYQLSKRSR